MKIILKNINLEFLADSFDVDVFIYSQETVENPEFKAVIVDAENKILWGRYTNDSTTDIDLTGMTIDGVSVTKIVNKIIEKYNL